MGTTGPHSPRARHISRLLPRNGSHSGSISAPSVQQNEKGTAWLVTVMTDMFKLRSQNFVKNAQRAYQFLQNCFLLIISNATACWNRFSWSRRSAGHLLDPDLPDDGEGNASKKAAKSLKKTGKANFSRRQLQRQREQKVVGISATSKSTNAAMTLTTSFSDDAHLDHLINDLDAHEVIRWSSLCNHYSQVIRVEILLL